jgi:DNA-binding CsgD family transcriptional regulator
MSKSTAPTRQQFLDVLHLMADVAALKGDPPAQRQALIDGLGNLVGIRQGVLVVGDHWRPGGAARYSHMTAGGESDPVYSRYIADVMGLLPPGADAFADRSIHDGSPMLEQSMGQVLMDRDAERRYPESADCRSAGRLSESIAHWVRLDGDRVLGLGLHAFSGERAPTGRDRAMIRFAAGEIQWLVRRGHLVLPPAAPPELPPRLRQVLDLLLPGRNPKGIASDLGLSVWTVRDHIKRVYRHFGVSGRDELSARFVRID